MGVNQKRAAHFLSIAVGFLALLAIAICFISIRDMSTKTSWLLGVGFAVLALGPDSELEDEG
jgi:hypothetical protein